MVIGDKLAQSHQLRNLSDTVRRPSRKEMKQDRAPGELRERI